MHPNLKLLSNSSCVTLHKCPRKFQLYRLKTPLSSAQESRVDLIFGSWVGNGIQEYMISKNLDKAYWKMFSSSPDNPMDEDGERSKKTFSHAMLAIDKFAALWESELMDYDLVTLPNGTHAVELGFILNCFDGFSYRGFLDALLIHKVSKTLVVMESKTTKFNNIHEAVYKNSGQGLGYSLITDTIAELLSVNGVQVNSSWRVFYPVWKAGVGEWEVFDFPKSNKQRIMWLKNLLRDISHITEYAEDDNFPMHGESCYDYFRPCEYFEVCGLNTEAIAGSEDKIKVQIEDDNKYQFKFELMDIIETQQARLA